MIVTIPSSQNHGGVGLVTLEIADTCPVCGGPRGEIFGAHSYDGSRRLNVDCWFNSCGHVDTYTQVRAEGKQVAYKPPTEFNTTQVKTLPF